MVFDMIGQKKHALLWLHRLSCSCIELAPCHRLHCVNRMWKLFSSRSHTLLIKEQKWKEPLAVKKWRVKSEVITFMEAVGNPKSAISYWLIEKCQTKTTSLQWLFTKSLASMSSMGRKLLDIYLRNSAELQPILSRMVKFPAKWLEKGSTLKAHEEEIASTSQRGPHHPWWHT